MVFCIELVFYQAWPAPSDTSRNLSLDDSYPEITELVKHTVASKAHRQPGKEWSVGLLCSFVIIIDSYFNNAERSVLFAFYFAHTA